MSRPLLTSLIASTLTFAPAADVRFSDEPFALPSGEVIEQVCYERRADRMIVAALFEDRVSFYYDGDASGTIEGSSDRVADLSGERATLYYPDASLDLYTQKVLGPIYRSGVAHIESSADWEGHLDAIARFMSAAEEYEMIRGRFDAASGFAIATCDLAGVFAPYNPF